MTDKMVIVIKGVGIKPDTDGTTYIRFSQHRELISEGEQTAHACLPELIKELRKNGLII